MTAGGRVRGGCHLDTGWGLRRQPRARSPTRCRATATTGFRIAYASEEAST